MRRVGKDTEPNMMETRIEALLDRMTVEEQVRRRARVRPWSSGGFADGGQPNARRY
jgi:hypothetical protein